MVALNIIGGVCSLLLMYGFSALMLYSAWEEFQRSQSQPGTPFIVEVPEMSRL